MTSSLILTNNQHSLHPMSPLSTTFPSLLTLPTPKVGNLLTQMENSLLRKTINAVLWQSSFLLITRYLDIDVPAVLVTDLDSYEKKGWREPGADQSDYFNYGTQS